MHEYIGIGRAANPAPYGLLIGEGVAIRAEQRAFGGALEFPFVGLRVALAKVDLAAAKVEQADHAVAVEKLVALEKRRELRVRVHTMIGPVQLRGQLAVDLEIVNVALEADGPQGIAEAGGVRIVCHGISSSARCKRRLYRAGAAFRRTVNSSAASVRPYIFCVSS